MLNLIFSQYLCLCLECTRVLKSARSIVYFAVLRFYPIILPKLFIAYACESIPTMIRQGVAVE